MEYFTFAAEKEDVGTRLDVFLAENMEAVLYRNWWKADISSSMAAA